MLWGPKTNIATLPAPPLHCVPAWLVPRIPVGAKTDRSGRFERSDVITHGFRYSSHAGTQARGGAGNVAVVVFGPHSIIPIGAIEENERYPPGGQEQEGPDPQSGPIGRSLVENRSRFDLTIFG